MNKWVIIDPTKNKQDNPKIEHNRKPGKDILEPSSTVSVVFSSVSTSLTTSESKNLHSKKVKRLNKLNDLWLGDPNFSGWLSKYTNMKDGNDLAKCRLCLVSILAHKSALIRHINSGRHKKKSLEIQNVEKISTYFSVRDLEVNVRRAELKLAGAIAEINIPMSFMDFLGPLCKDIFPDSVIAKSMNLHRTKATAIIKNILGNTFVVDINERLCIEKNFFSLITDETTDQSSMKQCCFTAVVYDDKINKVKHLFLDMVEVSSGTSTGTDPIV